MIQKHKHANKKKKQSKITPKHPYHLKLVEIKSMKLTPLARL